MQKNLTEKQKRFCEEYAKNPNATKAYMSAGYKATEEAARRNGSRLLTNADIQLYIEELSEEVRSESIADIEEVKRFWTTTLRGDNDCDYKDRLKASELIAKSSGAFIEKIEHSGGVGGVLVVPSAVSQDEWVKLAQVQQKNLKEK